MTDEPRADESAEQRKPTYASAGSFLGLLDKAKKTGVPDVIDRHYLGGSGTYQSQMYSALRFLQLVDEENRPTEELRDLVEKEDERPQMLRRLVERHYEGALALGPRAPQSQLDAWFRQQGVSGGDTIRKAETFFLALARAAGLETSPHFKPSTRSTSSQPKKKAVPRKRAPEPEPAPAEPEPAPPEPPSSPIHPAVRHLLDKIPAPGVSWTKKERDLLVETFGNLLDLFHPVVDQDKGAADGG